MRANRSLMRRILDDGLEIVEHRSASQVNAQMIAEGAARGKRWFGSYVENTKIFFGRTVKNKEEFVRVFTRVSGKKRDNMVRSWIMRKTDIKGLSAKQIRAKYNLTTVPSHIVDVALPRGTRVKISLTNKIKAFGLDAKGGAIQYEIDMRYYSQEELKQFFDLKSARQLKGIIQ
jgi:hypothetical protein